MQKQKRLSFFAAALVTLVQLTQPIYAVTTTTSSTVENDSGLVINLNNSKAGIQIQSTTTKTANDEYLQPGFPVKSMHTEGSYWGGPGIHTLIADIAGSSSDKEIIRTGLSTGPLYAWNYLGNTVSGWPVTTSYNSVQYPVAVNRGVVTGNYGVCNGSCIASISLINGNGSIEWTRTAGNSVQDPFTAVRYFPGAFADSKTFWLFGGEYDYFLHGYKTNSTLATGWPKNNQFSQEMHTPAVADVTGDNRMRDFVKVKTIL